VGGDRVPLVRVLRALPRPDRGPEPGERILDRQRLEDDVRISLGRLLRLADQSGGVTDPDVLDLPAARVVDQHRERVRRRSRIAERDRQRLLPPAGVREMPALPDPG
jgi:hypothetical protein